MDARYRLCNGLVAERMLHRPRWQLRNAALPVCLHCLVTLHARLPPRRDQLSLRRRLRRQLLHAGHRLAQPALCSRLQLLLVVCSCCVVSAAMHQLPQTCQHLAQRPARLCCQCMVCTACLMLHQRLQVLRLLLQHLHLQLHARLPLLQ